MSKQVALHRPLRWVAAVALACVVAVPAEAGRVRPDIECVIPAAGSEVSYAPLDLLINLNAQTDEQTMHVVLNGTDVTSAFALATPYGYRQLATASDVWGGVVLPGTNLVTATVRLENRSAQPLALPAQEWVSGLRRWELHAASAYRTRKASTLAWAPRRPSAASRQEAQSDMAS